MNVIREIQRITEEELKHNIFGGRNGSWHDRYKNCAWVFLGGLPYKFTEGDVLCFMSQWGEIDDLNLIRDENSGKSKGFCFVKYSDQRSTILAVDNFNGMQLCGRTLRVDHVSHYKMPRKVWQREEEGEEVSYGLFLSLCISHPRSLQLSFLSFMYRP